MQNPLYELEDADEGDFEDEISKYSTEHRHEEEGLHQVPHLLDLPHP